MRFEWRPDQTTFVFVTSSSPPAFTAIEPPPIPSMPYTTPSSATTLEQYDSVFIASQNQRLGDCTGEEIKVEAQRLMDDLRSLPKQVQRAMIGKFRVMVETATDFNGYASRRPAYLREDSRERDWKMLNSNH